MKFCMNLLYINVLIFENVMGQLSEFFFKEDRYLELNLKNKI